MENSVTSQILLHTLNRNLVYLHHPRDRPRNAIKRQTHFKVRTFIGLRRMTTSITDFFRVVGTMDVIFIAKMKR
jgi:hypothetical protein